jgi:hypothetical protein
MLQPDTRARLVAELSFALHETQDDDAQERALEAVLAKPAYAGLTPEEMLDISGEAVTDLRYRPGRVGDQGAKS